MRVWGSDRTRGGFSISPNAPLKKDAPFGVFILAQICPLKIS